MADRIILVFNTESELVLFCSLPAEFEDPETNLFEVISYAWKRVPLACKRGELYKAYIHEIEAPKQFTGSIHEISRVSKKLDTINFTGESLDSPSGVSVEPRGAFIERRRNVLSRAIQESADMHIPIFMPWVIEHNARQEELDKMSDEEKLGQQIFKMSQ